MIISGEEPDCASQGILAAENTTFRVTPAGAARCKFVLEITSQRAVQKMSSTISPAFLAMFSQRSRIGSTPGASVTFLFDTRVIFEAAGEKHMITATDSSFSLSRSRVSGGAFQPANPANTPRMYPNDLRIPFCGVSVLTSYSRFTQP
jgi:hypothetical protein